MLRRLSAQSSRYYTSFHVYYRCCLCLLLVSLIIHSSAGCPLVPSVTFNPAAARLHLYTAPFGSPGPGIHHRRPPHFASPRCRLERKPSFFVCLRTRKCAGSAAPAT